MPRTTLVMSTPQHMALCLSLNNPLKRLQNQRFTTISNEIVTEVRVCPFFNPIPNRI